MTVYFLLQFKVTRLFLKMQSPREKAVDRLRE